MYGETLAFRFPHPLLQLAMALPEWSFWKNNNMRRPAAKIIVFCCVFQLAQSHNAGSQGWRTLGKSVGAAAAETLGKSVGAAVVGNARNSAATNSQWPARALSSIKGAHFGVLLLRFRPPRFGSKRRYQSCENCV